MNEFLTMTNKEFAAKCTDVAKSVLTAWCDNVQCGTTDGKKQFCLMASHSWGAAYCNWDYRKRQLLDALRDAGAVNISGKVRWNFVRIYFDKRQRPMKSTEV